MSKCPNFILFITDQHRADFLGCYGHRVLRTPHIDSIAAKGTMFSRLYVASPVCMPNRGEPDDGTDTSDNEQRIATRSLPKNGHEPSRAVNRRTRVQS